MKLIPKKAHEIEDKFFMADLVSETNLHPVIADLLVKRGLDDMEEIKDFINPNLNKLHDPYLFKDMDKTVTRIKEAINNNEVIWIYGDYDVDGMTATTILINELRLLGADPKFYIPKRSEGYGLNNNAIKNINEKGNAGLIITVDCGITSVNEVKYNNDNFKSDIIITDHHQRAEVLPDAFAIINPSCDETYPFKGLSGAGVALKLALALNGSGALLRNIDLVAISTIADLVPLVDENRVLVSAGMVFINKQREKMRPGVWALFMQLFEDKGVPKTIRTDHIGFGIAPMLNATGRIGNPRYGVILLESNKPEIINEISRQMKELNNQRKEIEQQLTALSMREIDETQRFNFVGGENWQEGVIGIVASRLTEHTFKPSFVMSYHEDGTITGSCRSIEGISIHEALQYSERNLIKWGGHPMAGGFSLHKDNLEGFKKDLTSFMNKIDEDTFSKTIRYDMEVNIKEIDVELLKGLTLIYPFGVGNPKPIFVLRNAEFKNLRVFRKDKTHFFGTVEDEYGQSVGFTAFNQEPPLGKKADIVFSPNINQGKMNINIDAFIESEKAEFSDGVKYKVPKEHIPISRLGFPTAKNNQFNETGIKSIQDLLLYLPKDYLDFRKPILFSEAVEGEMIAIEGVITKTSPGRGKMVSAWVQDDSGTTFKCVWFNQNFVYNRLYVGSRYIFCGVFKTGYTGELELQPVLFDQNISKYKKLIPTYKKIKGMSDDYLMNSFDKAFELLDNTDYLEKEVVDEYNLLTSLKAYEVLHQPNNFEELEKGINRHVFDTLFEFSYNLKLKNNDSDDFNTHKLDPELNKVAMDESKKVFPYELTIDQNKALDKISDLTRGKKTLNALIQGDVGSGKTIVAFIAMMMAIRNGKQSLLVAPTNVLATQHYHEFKEYADKLGITIELLTGATHAATKRRILRELKEGKIDMLVGTHATFSKNVEYKELALVVIDEQHRFGVDQRESFSKYNPHIITMSATPIPRTLSMAMFGQNINVLNIKTRPKGRKPIITKKMTDDKHVNEFILEEIKQGRQAYVICPLVEESDSDKMANVTSVKEEEEKLKKYFKSDKDVKIAAISGKMKKKEVEEIITKFEKNEIQILVSTTIVEVGVNVPNASVIVLKNSERFGLAQAHQLRGRVGRGNDQGYCLLQTEVPGEEKAEVLLSTTDGFEIAHADLNMRGAGDYIGTKQTGHNNAVMLMMKEPELFEKIGKTVNQIFEDKKRKEYYSFLTIKEEA